MIAPVGPYFIRSIDPWEAPRVFALTGDPDVMRYMGFRRHENEVQAMQLIQRYNTNQHGRYFAVCSEDDPMIGIAGFEVQGHSATLTLMFRNDRAVRGAGRRFSVPFVQWIFTHPQIWRVWSYVHVDNIAGQRVTERTGAQREGRLRRFEFFPNVSDEPQDVYIYSIVRDKR